jgi:hypothetical protein
MAVRRFDLEEIKKLFEPNECRMVAVVCQDPRVELWETGWKEPFTLSPEGGYYSEFEWRKAQVLFAKTMPPGWNIRKK